MSEFTLIYEGRIREQYIVEAETEEEARDKWSDTEPFISEVVDGGIVEVFEESNDE